MNILIIGPVQVMDEQLVQKIKSWGHQSEKCLSGKKALVRVKEKYFDLVLMEIFLPDVQSEDLISQMKKIRPNIEIITMTGANSRELELNIRKLGIIYYMIKPFEAKHLKPLIDHISTIKDRKITFNAKAMIERWQN